MQDFFQKLQQQRAILSVLIQKMAESPIMVIGDMSLDEFLTGEAERISREAPVVIVRHEKTVQVPGGGGNTMYNLADLGAKVQAVSLVGNDYYGEKLRLCLQAKNIDINGISILSDFITTAKTRIAAHSRQSVTQQIVRLDRKEKKPIPTQEQDKLAAFVRQNLSQVQAIICSDYGDGVLSESVIAAALQHKLVIVDAQKDLLRYKGATIFTPNLPEAEREVGYFITNEEKLLQAGNDLLQLTEAQYMLITRGEKGMTLFEKTTTEVLVSHIPPFHQSQVFDVTGAGDTVTAVLALAMSVGATAWQAAVLGNLAASLVVRKFGTATVTREELKEALQHFA